MATLKQITAKAKTIYKPGKMLWTDAIKKASAQLSGIKPKKIAGVAKRKKKRKVVSGVAKAKPVAKRSVTVGKTKRVGAIGAVGAGFKVIREIDSLEAKLKHTKGVDQRNFVKAAINAKHDKLDSLRRNIK